MNDSTFPPELIKEELIKHIVTEIGRLHGELLKVNAQPFQNAGVLTGICTQLGAYHALLSTFTSAKQAEHLDVLVKQTDRLVEESMKLTALTKTLKWLTLVLAILAFSEIAIGLVEKLCQHQ